MPAELHVLLVEDNESYAAYIRDELTHANRAFRVTVADSLGRAIAELARGGVDVVLLDLNLPDSDGLQTFRNLQAAAPAVPMVILSGIPDQTLATAAVQAGAQDYLVKPHVQGPIVGRVLQYAVERRGAEARLRERDAHYRAIVESSLDAIISVDAAGRVIEFNPEAERLFGWPRAAVLGRELASLIVPERLRASHRQALSRHAANSDARVGRRRLGFPALRADGSEVPVELTLSKVKQAAGPIFTGFIRDLSERRRAEEAQRVSDELLAQARDAIIVRNLDHSITYYNRSAERLYGWTAAEVMGQSARERFFPDLAIFDDAMAQLLQQGGWHGEMAVTGRDGVKLIVESRWTLTRDADGHPRAVLVIDTDVTERKELERRFLRAQRMESIGTLAGGIAHDLNNMLTPVLMSIELLKENPAEEERNEILSTIEASTRRGAEMVRQVLTFARGVEGERTAVDITDLLHGIEKFANDTFMKSIAVKMDVAADVGQVLGDVTQLHQVLINLCVNARDAMPDGGVLTLSVRQESIDAGSDAGGRPGSYVAIRVTDTGTGIPPRILDRIFEPFFTSKPVGKGTGLGLSTSQAIVKSHGGFMRVDSEVNRGSRFTVYLPALSVHRTAAAPEAITPARTRGTGELVLVVDDEEPLLRMTSLVLESFGYRVLLASSGADAIALFTRHRDKIKVVITDMTMPVMDGAAVIKRIRELDPNARIIAASGLGAQAASDVPGVMHFLPKPLTADALLKAVTDVIRR